MKIDLDAVFAGQISYADMIRDVHHADLYRMTGELFDTLTQILSPATDAAVLFVPRDPAASDDSERGWTLSHIVAHLTATLEESAAMAAMFARGVPAEGRLRFEVPWQELSSLALVRARLQESQRICRAFLDAWPDAPHLNVTRTLIPLLGPLDAVGIYLLGIAHGQGHVDQLRETVQQFTSSSDL
ncbi:MAG: DinB family protein [Chloroflexota bacterium]|nr:DinB family protein [Chloroflexota bacterium]